MLPFSLRNLESDKSHVHVCSNNVSNTNVDTKQCT